MWNISKFLNNASRNVGNFINSSADFVGKMTNKINDGLTKASNFFDNYIVPASKATVIATEYMKNSNNKHLNQFANNSYVQGANNIALNIVDDVENKKRKQNIEKVRKNLNQVGNIANEIYHFQQDD